MTNPVTKPSKRALVVTGPGSVSLEERPPALAPPGEVVVSPSVVGLCGTDLEIIDGRIDPAYVRYPLVLGHEWCGVLDGPDAKQLVVAEGVVACGHCERCRQGRTNLCETYDEVGFTRDGALADEVVVPRRVIHLLDQAVDRSAAALVEPMAVVFQGLDRARPKPGWRVLVIGDGTVGLLSALLVRLYSPSVVDLVGARSAQEDLALEAGADSFSTPEQAPKGDYDLVVEAAGSSRAAGMALDSARRGGAVLLLGLPPHGEKTPVAVDDVVNRDLAVHASFSYTSSSFAEVAGLLSTGAVEPSFLVTHRLALEEWPAALEALRQPVGARGKVVIEL